MIKNIEFTGDGLILLAGVSQLIIDNNEYYVRLAIESINLKNRLVDVSPEHKNYIFPREGREIEYVTIEISEEKYIQLLQQGVEKK